MQPEDGKNALRELRRFRIVLTDGRTYEVRSPDLVWVGRRTLHVGFPAAEGDPYFDQFTIVSLLHVVRLEPLPAANPAEGNGE